MHWLLIITLTLNGKSVTTPWALTPDARTCRIAGGAVTRVLREQVPGLHTSFTCAEERRV